MSAEETSNQTAIACPATPKSQQQTAAWHQVTSLFAAPNYVALDHRAPSQAASASSSALHATQTDSDQSSYKKDVSHHISGKTLYLLLSAIK